MYKRALFDLQFVHNLFWLKLKWNARSKLFYCIIYHSSMLWWSSRTLTKLKSQSQKRFNERQYKYLKYKNKNHSGTHTSKLSDINLAPNLNLSFVQNTIEDLIQAFGKYWNLGNGQILQAFSWSGWKDPLKFLFLCEFK